MQRYQIKYKPKPITLADTYKEYLLLHPKGTKYYLTAKRYREVNERFFELIHLYMITTGEPVKLPHGLGYLRLRRRRTSEELRKIDYFQTKKYKKAIYHENNHSNGYYVRYKWDKTRIYLKNKNMYGFRACRWANRFLAKNIKENNSIVKYYG